MLPLARLPKFTDEPAPMTMTIDELVALYLREKRDEKKSPHTLRDYARHLGHVWGGARGLDGDDERVRNYVLAAPSAVTRNSRISNLKPFWNWLNDNDFRTPPAPWPRGLKKTKLDDKPAVMSEKMFSEIITAFKRRSENGSWHTMRDCVFVLVLAVSGVRPGELLDVCPVDVDLSGKIIRLERTKTSVKRAIPITGAEKPIAELMKFHAMLIGRGFFPATAPLFCGPSGRRFSDPGLQHMFSVVRRDHGGWVDPNLKRSVTPYDFRHHFATRAVVGGLHPTIVAAIMGHASLNTTKKYVHPSTAEISSLGGGVVELPREVLSRGRRKPRAEKGKGSK